MLAGLPPLGRRKIFGDIFIALLFELEHLETFSKMFTSFFREAIAVLAGLPPLGGRKFFGYVFIALLFELEHLETFSKN